MVERIEEFASECLTFGYWGLIISFFLCAFLACGLAFACSFAYMMTGNLLCQEISYGDSIGKYQNFAKTRMKIITSKRENAVSYIIRNRKKRV